MLNPGRIPLSGETITIGGLRRIMSRELDDVEMLMAGQAARLVGATGITDDIENEVRRKIEAEKEARRATSSWLSRAAPTASPLPAPTR